MLNFDYLRIPRDDDFEEEPEDEFAAAGFRVVDGADAEAEEGVEESVEKVIDAEVAPEDDKDEEDTEGPVDGLAELEELEKGVAAIPISYGQDDE